MKVLVTGTTGLIGYNLSKRLLKDGYEVFGVIHKKDKKITDVVYQSGDLQDREFCDRVTDGIDIVINDIEYCPYHPDGTVKKYKKKSAYRKPGNMMIKKIYKKWNIDIKKSFMIGDKKSDKLAARKSNLYYEYVSSNLYLQVKKIDKKVSNNY